MRISQTSTRKGAKRRRQSKPLKQIALARPLATEAEIRAEREAAKAAPRCPRCLLAASMAHDFTCRVASCPDTFILLAAKEVRTVAARVPHGCAINDSVAARTCLALEVD